MVQILFLFFTIIRRSLKLYCENISILDINYVKNKTKFDLFYMNVISIGIS